ncbi:MAG: SDR family oxidoreductase [Xanthomonadaceae bacterium]|nr:SDR family oxidoreductase [Xanthomonadaceae bacterium]
MQKFKTLITGASQGIGAALAYEMSKRGSELFLVARSREKLERVADECKKLGSPVVKVSSYDLSDAKSWDAVASEAEAFDINVLINNAGYGLWGQFAEQGLDELYQNMRLNMDAVVTLTHRLIPQLKRAQPSYVLNVSSTTAYQALPTFAVYAASKSFVLSWSRAIHHELKRQGVSVTALVPGATDTGFIDRAGLQHAAEAAKKVSMSAESVARIGIDGMLRGRVEVVPGFINKLSAHAIPLLPKQLIEKAAASLYNKK